MGKIIDKVTELAIPVIEKNDCELWGVEFVKEAGVRYLRVFIDRVDGVSINHCEVVSKELDPMLDEYDDLFPESYTFEVSSAGVERQLRGPNDFKRFDGHYVEVKLYKAKNGQKIYHGNLTNWDNSGVEIETETDSLKHKFTNQEVATVRLRLK